MGSEPDIRTAAPAGLEEENALLRAALADMRARLEEVESAAERDPLTGLPDAGRFARELERVVAQANRHATPAAMVAVELVSLRDINERRGRIAGDAALAHLARTLGGLIRSSDFAARTGGSHFALLLDHLDAESAIDTAERIERCIAAQPLDLGGTLLPLRAAVAVATILQGDSVEDVRRRAEISLERARLF